MCAVKKLVSWSKYVCAGLVHPEGVCISSVWTAARLFSQTGKGAGVCGVSSALVVCGVTVAPENRLRELVCGVRTV